MDTKKLSLQTKDKIALFDNLSTMLAAGISILEAVDSLLEDSKGNQKKLLSELRQDLTQGKQVYASFARFPNTFDKVTVNIIRASEEAGTLDVALKDIKKHVQNEMEFLDKIRSAMIYPIVIMVVFFLVMLLILIFVMPKLASVFGRMDVELPLPTKILMFMSDLIIHNTLALIVGVVLLILGFIVLYIKKRAFVLRIFFSFPLISGLIKQIDIARFTRSMALLLSSGLTITNALELCEEIVWRRDMQKLVAHTQKSVLSGKRFAEGIRDGKGLVPMIVIKLVEAGEKTGSLDKAMQDVSEHMDYEVQRSLNTLTTLLEPVMLLFIGVVVGGMMLSIIAPIYSLIGQVGAR
ncbi:type II secretion system F family protein [Candidatus Roizmanbacteria bacterium]|nr:MAG: type II secretion system F family protein [Candidatus Roizmanbacteria bacterium]